VISIRRCVLDPLRDLGTSTYAHRISISLLLNSEAVLLGYWVHRPADELTMGIEINKSAARCSMQLPEPIALHTMAKQALTLRVREPSLHMREKGRKKPILQGCVCNPRAERFMT
jgi:hypothetical protein